MEDDDGPPPLVPRISASDYVDEGVQQQQPTQPTGEADMTDQRPTSALSTFSEIQTMRPVRSAQSHRGEKRADGTLVDVAEMTHGDSLKDVLLPEYHARYSMSPLHVAAAGGVEGNITTILKQSAAYQVQVDQEDKVGRTALFFAVLSGSKACVDTLIQWGCDVNHQDADGRGALSWASYHDRAKVIRSLLDAGAKVRQEDKEGRSSLHWATSTDSTKVLSLLLGSQSAQTYGFLDAGDVNNMNVLHYAAFHNRVKQVQMLVKAGANPLAIDADGKTPIHWTAGNKDGGAVKALMSISKEVANSQDPEGRSIVHLAVTAGQDSEALLTAALKHNNCNVNLQDAHGRTPLHYSAAFGNKAAAALLCAKNPDFTLTDNHGAGPLHYTAQHNQPEVATIFLGRKTGQGAASVRDNDGRPALFWAIMKGNTEVTRALLESSFVNVNEVDNSQFTALHIAALVAQPESAKLLLSKPDVVVNGKDGSGRTPLHTACEQPDLAVARLLLEADANVASTDNDGRTPVHIASIAGNSEAVKLLAQQGKARVNDSDSAQETPLHYACHYGHLGVAQELVARGATINVQDRDGISPLHWCALQGHVDIVRLLLENQAYPNFMEHDGNRATPLDYAVAGQQMECAQLLVDHGGVYHENFAEYAAVRIQSLWKGFVVRKRFKKVIAEAALERRERDKAATKIQAHARGFLARSGYQAQLRDAELERKSRAEREAAERAAAEERERVKQEREEKERKLKEKRAKEEALRKKRAAEAKAREETLASREAKRREEKMKRLKQEEKRLLEEQRRRQEEIRRHKGIWGDMDQTEHRQQLLMQQQVRKSLIVNEKSRVSSVRKYIAAATTIQRWYRAVKAGTYVPRRRVPRHHLQQTQQRRSYAPASPPRSQPPPEPVKLPPIRAAPRRPTKQPSKHRKSGKANYNLEQRRRVVAALTIQLWWRRVLAVKMMRRYQKMPAIHGPEAAVRVQSQRLTTVYDTGSDVKVAKAVRYVPRGPLPNRYVHQYSGPSAANQSFSSALTSYYDVAGSRQPARLRRSSSQGHGIQRQNSFSRAKTLPRISNSQVSRSKVVV